jgi:steroid 5-alpha reductase family enzyme
VVIRSNQCCLYLYVSQYMFIRLLIDRSSPPYRGHTATTQDILLFLIATPTLVAATHPSPLALSDAILTVTALALLAFEFVADNQQFAFHAWKHGTYDARAHWPGARLAWTKDDAARGFCTRGLWSWSRHPNFFAEQSFWVRRLLSLLCPFANTLTYQKGVLNLFPILALRLPGAPASVSPDKRMLIEVLRALFVLSPSLGLCLLFIGSTIFTESISASKYPRGYAAYRSRVAMFVPFLTPVWGALLSVTGGKREVEELVWGSGAREATEAKDRVKAE